MNQFKTNFDGAVFAKIGEVGIGVVVRDNPGKVKVAMSEKIYAPSSVVVLEAMAARRAAAFTREVGVGNCILEGDSQAVVTALQEGKKLFSEYGHILQGTLSHLNSFKNWSLSYTPRQGNEVADALDRRAKKSFLFSVWLDFLPPDVVAFVNADFPST